MNHDICYRDHNTKKGKLICDDEMLKELDELEPENIRKRIDKKIVNRIIKSKRKIGLGVVKWNNELADELHKPVRKKNTKNGVYSLTMWILFGLLI